MLSHHVFIYAVDRAIKQFILRAAVVAVVIGLVVWFIRH
jgi:hypothetical protein